MDISRVEDTNFPAKRYIRTGDKLYDLSVPKIMGILNVTPDSFYEASRNKNLHELLNTVEQMIKDGADMLDLGAYSTRPGAAPVSAKEEINRLEKPIGELKKYYPEIPLSIDTFRAEVARTSIESGADIINDISGFQYDPEIADVAAYYKKPYILMHVAKNYQDMHQSSENPDFFQDLMRYFSEKIEILTQKGVTDILIDPGFGFSKTMEQNYYLMNKLNELQLFEHPLLVGISRKSMIYKKLGCKPEEALNGTTILNTQAILKGASILRVHDVREAREIIQLTCS